MTNWKQRALDAEAQLANRPAELDQARADLDAARERGNELHAEAALREATADRFRVALWKVEDQLRDIPDNVEALVDVLEPRQHMGVHQHPPRRQQAIPRRLGTARQATVQGAGNTGASAGEGRCLS